MEKPPKLNVKNILKLADFLATKEYEFDMVQSDAHPNCGSAGCIGGHAAVLWRDLRTERGDDSYSWYDPGLEKKLGLTHEQHDELCYPGDYGLVKRHHAVTVLRRLAKTGKVHWKFLGHDPV